jgi:hypothetical protein
VRTENNFLFHYCSGELKKIFANYSYSLLLAPLPTPTASIYFVCRLNYSKYRENMAQESFYEKGVNNKENKLVKDVVDFFLSISLCLVYYFSIKIKIEEGIKNWENF